MLKQLKSQPILKIFKGVYIYTFGISLLMCGMPFLVKSSASENIPPNLQDIETKAYTRKSFVARALEKTGPAVVTIETEKRVINNNKGNLPKSFLIDPYFERFFGIPNIQSPRSTIERRQGSGVIFSSKGLVITNAHVVEETDELIVGLSNGKRIVGKVVGQDYLTDLAVIRLEGKGPWPKAFLGDSNKIIVGDWAIAVGNPYGLEKTVTLGIISNLNRNVSQLGISDKRLNLIQTDAAINPGNSGGPLLNSDGEVIGINTLVQSGPGAGLGFAIPINKAIEIANQLVEKGQAIHPMIGVHLSHAIVNTEKIKYGATIEHILPGGPAEKQGFNLKDIIIKINEKDIRGPADVVDSINTNGVDKAMKFIILRGNVRRFITVKPVDIRSFRVQ